MTIQGTEGAAHKKTLTVGVAQVQPQLADLDVNLAKVAGFVERAVEAGVELLVFPELALTGYPVGSWFSTASIGRQSPEFFRLQELSQQMPMIVGVIEETEEAEFFNSALYLHDGDVRHLHRKVYLPTYREFDERRYFMAGWSVSAFDTPWCRMAILICGDCWHLGLPYLAAHDGADVLVVLAASSESGLTHAISSRDAWERMNRSYALTLSNFVVFANLVGDLQGTRFWGGSHVVLPDGGVFSQANGEQEELLVSTLDLTQLRRQRLILPFRRDDSLALTTTLGREVLRRKRHRSSGLFGAVRQATASPSGLAPISSDGGEPPFPPVGVSDTSFGSTAALEDVVHSNTTPQPDKPSDAD